MQRVLVIANPIAGRGRGQALADSLCALLAARGDDVELRLTTAERNGGALVRDVLPGAHDRLVVIGGDGSVNDVLNGLDDPAIPIAVLPAGTANVWAREMRLPREPQAHATMLQHGRVIDVALGRANGQRFFLFVGAGLDARIVAAVEQRRARRAGRGGMAQWWLPGLRVLARRDAELSLTVGERTLPRLRQVLVTRVRRYAGSLDLGCGIDAGDGELHALAFPAAGKLRWFALGLRALRGALRPGQDLEHVATNEPMRIAAAGAEPYHVDGTAAGCTPVAIELDPRSARFVVPAARV